jgi:hypothetical protein
LYRLSSNRIRCSVAYGGNLLRAENGFEIAGVWREAAIYAFGQKSRDCDRW